MNEKTTIKILLVIMLIFSILAAFEAGYYFSLIKDKTKFNSFVSDSNTRLENLEGDLGIKNETISSLSNKMTVALTRNKDYEKNITELEGKIAGLEDSQQYPFQVPTSGIVGTFNGTFGGNMNGFRHLGIDIWTSIENSGHIANHKGNPVFSACDGQVTNIDPANGGIVILCDEIEGDYFVPEKLVYTYYGHLGHAETHELYIEVSRGQRVTKGQKIGFQGDLSSYFPEMRNVHLHFSVFTGLSETDKKGGALNPCLYIGGDCSRAGEKFLY